MSDGASTSPTTSGTDAGAAAGAELEPEVLVERRGRLGQLTLNRPRVMNALNHSMVGVLFETLTAWADDPEVETVLLTGAGDRGLCAGGDIVSLYRDAVEGGGEASAAFWRDEYRLDALIANYPKPYVAFMDGVVLGGGVGLSAHASHRIVTERTRVGMPETGIGYIPDVGGTWLLSRAPGELGTHAALTGDMMSGADALALGLADAFLPSERLGELARALETTEAGEAIAVLEEAPPASELLLAEPLLDEAYAGDSLAEIAERLAASEDELARTAAATLAKRSPTAMAVTLRSLRAAAGFDRLEDALRQEYRVSTAALRHPDFAEGIRAQVIDKDRAPKWRPATIAEVDPAVVEGYFQPVEPELELGQ